MQENVPGELGHGHRLGLVANLLGLLRLPGNPTGPSIVMRNRSLVPLYRIPALAKSWSLTFAFAARCFPPFVSVFQVPTLHPF